MIGNIVPKSQEHVPYWHQLVFILFLNTWNIFLLAVIVFLCAEILFIKVSFVSDRPKLVPILNIVPFWLKLVPVGKIMFLNNGICFI